MHGISSRGIFFLIAKEKKNCQRLLDSNVLQALGTTTTAQLWASAVELLEDGDVTQLTVTSFGQSLVRVSGEIAAALFASAFGL